MLTFHHFFFGKKKTAALDDLEAAYVQIKDDPEFLKELKSYDSYVGRATPMYFADRLTKETGGAQIWLKREDLAHTGAHKINNARAFIPYENNHSAA